MTIPKSWLDSPYALVHGEDSEGRRNAVEAWKARHVDPEWAEFSLSVCSEHGPWAEVSNALQEAAPLGAERVVIVPQADNLLAKPKDLPDEFKGGRSFALLKPTEASLVAPEAIQAFCEHWRELLA